MALKKIAKLNPPTVTTRFYQSYYPYLIYGLMGLIVLLSVCIVVTFYLIQERPLPQFFAIQPDKKETLLTPYDEPNLLPDTILRWASKAATAAYTFDFVNYQSQMLAAKPYFTEQGWTYYSNSVNDLISRIVQGQLFVNGVVVGPPVISNEGPLPGRDYVWRVQIPFIVTYQSANVFQTRNYIVILSIVRVPTSVNQQGIGIDQLVMV